MKNFLKSKWFIISTLCIITITIGSTVLAGNRLNKNKAVATTNTAKNTVSTKDTEKKQIYGTFTTESSWVKDPSEPKNLLEGKDDNYIIKVKVKSIGEAVFLEKTKDFYSSKPFTPVEVIVEQTLYGQTLNRIKTIYLRGGDVKISELMKARDEETNKKMGFYTLTKEQQETKYISFKTEYDYNLKPNEEYVLIVAKQSNNIYTVAANGYGIFKADKQSTNVKSISSEVVLKNVLTNKELTDKNGTVLKLK